jgi:hypothetical protein
MGEHITRMGQMRNAYEILIGKPEGKRRIGRLVNVYGMIIVKWILE